MRKGGILNRHLAGAIAELGHSDRVLVCDAGMPIPGGPRVVDLAFRAGVPSFEDVLTGLLDELVIEGALAAEEVRAANPAADALPAGSFAELAYVPHETLKELSAGARLVVRTGEARPYAKVLLLCGVFFQHPASSRTRGRPARRGRGCLGVPAVVRGCSPGAQTQGRPTSQLVSAAQLDALSQALEPPLPAT